MFVLNGRKKKATFTQNHKIHGWIDERKDMFNKNIFNIIWNEEKIKNKNRKINKITSYDECIVRNIQQFN